MSDPAALPAVDGGCLRGAVRDRAAPTHCEGCCCHRRVCRPAFGNTGAAFVDLRRNEVEWTRGVPSFYASSAFAERGFCAVAARH